MRRLLLLLLTASCFAQTQGNLPDLVDSFVSNTEFDGSSTQIQLREGVVAGQLLDVCVAYDWASASGGGPYPVNDTLGNTYTLTTPQVTASYNLNGRLAVYHAYTVSGSSGANTITTSVPAVSTRMAVGRYSGLSGTLDGSVQNSTQTTSGAQTISTTSTTTKNGSVGISCTISDAFGTNGWFGEGTSEYVANNFVPSGTCPGGGCSTPVFQTMLHTGVAGSYTMSDNTVAPFAFGSNSTFAKQTLFFRPSSTIAIVDTQMPDCAVGVSCSMQLHEVGGSGAITWACSGLPSNGLSLNTSTGVISGANPTLGTASIGCTATDGSVTSATANFSIVVRSSFLTPSVVEQRHADDELAGTASNHITFASNISCGQVIAVTFFGQDTHSREGWVAATAGVFNNVSDNLGTIFHRVGPITGSVNAPQIMFVGQVTQAGGDTVYVSNNSQSGGLAWTAAILNGVQPVVDRGTFNAGGFGGLSTSASYTSIVPNTILIGATNISSDNTGTASGLNYSGMTLAVSDYLTTASAGAGSLLVASPSTTTLNTSFASAPGYGDPVTSLFGYRPAATYTGACTVGAGEKYRRWSW